jgi:hypothetical protein
LIKDIPDEGRVAERAWWSLDILSLACECATCSVDISTDGLKDEIHEARRLAGLKNFTAHKQY